MRGIIEALIFRLKEKNVSPTELPKLIRDVMMTITDTREHTLKSVNRELGLAGWRKDVLDNYTFELILEFIESKSDHRDAHPSEH